jgi:4-amino-4-deoxy-L-arabinose transferase-like glycosyltransferase
MKRTHVKQQKKAPIPQQVPKAEKEKHFFEPIENLTAKKSFRISVSSIVFLFLIFSDLKDAKFTQYAQFGFDQWDYQSLGVNFAKGHGLNKFGCIENFEEYHFGRFDEYYDGRMNDFVNGAGNDNIYRTPGYTVFLGTIYYFFGPHPAVASNILLFLLILFSALLPFFGWYYWKTAGFYAGLIACFLSVAYHINFLHGVATEGLTNISYFFIVFSALYHDKTKSVFSAILLGITLGIGLLIKGSFIFVPIFLIAFLAFSYYKTKIRKTLLQLVLIVGSCILVVLPWSVYASSKVDSLVILSTQGGTVLLDCNNEYAQGGWSPEWLNDKNSFYNNDGMQKSSAIIRVFNFYKHYPSKFPEIMTKKIVYGFMPFLFLWLIIATLFIDSVGFFILKYLKNIQFYIIFNIAAVLILYGFIVYEWQFNYIKFYDSLSGWIYKFLILSLIPFILYAFKLRTDKTKEFKVIELPLVIKAVFLNFFLITTILLGDIYGRGNRYTAVINFVFISTAIVYFFSLSNFVIKKTKEIRNKILDSK